MAKSDLTVKIHIDGLREVLFALQKLPKDASNELKDTATELARELAGKAAAAGRAEGRQAAVVASTVRAQRDRVPVVVAGGSKRIGSRRKPAYKLLFGSEFGSVRYHQFKVHIGKGSYWFFQTIEDNTVEISAAWLKAADAVIRKFEEV